MTMDRERLGRGNPEEKFTKEPGTWTGRLGSELRGERTLTASVVAVSTGTTAMTARERRKHAFDEDQYMVTEVGKLTSWHTKAGGGLSTAGQWPESKVTAVTRGRRRRGSGAVEVRGFDSWSGTA